MVLFPFQVKLMNQIKEEASKSRDSERKRNIEINQLRKEQRQRDNQIQRLEAEKQKRDVILRRKQEEVESLRKRQLVMSSKVAGRTSKTANKQPSSSR
jgi:kinesin family protein 4/21/27